MKRRAFIALFTAVALMSGCGKKTETASQSVRDLITKNIADVSVVDSNEDGTVNVTVTGPDYIGIIEKMREQEKAVDYNGLSQMIKETADETRAYECVAGSDATGDVAEAFVNQVMIELFANGLDDFQLVDEWEDAE